MTTAIATRTGGARRTGKGKRRKGGRRRTPAAEREAMQVDSLRRAVCNQSLSNFPAIIEGFARRGIPVEDIRPRENVFTYNAWQALGRQVRKGEKGIAVVSYVPIDRERENPETGEREVKTYRSPRKAYVFHVSQTDPIDGAGPAVELPAPEPVHAAAVPVVAGLLEHTPD